MILFFIQVLAVVTGSSRRNKFFSFCFVYIISVSSVQVINHYFPVPGDYQQTSFAICYIEYT